MLSIVCLAMKGGTGNTSLSCALSVAAQRAGLPAALVDIDPQASAATWADRREATSPAVIGAQAPRLEPVLEAARNAGAQLAIIDSAPHASDAALAAARTADLIPFKASVADLDAIGTSIDIARMAGKATVVVINQATVGSTLIAEAHDAIAGYDVACAPVVVHHRLDHVRAFTTGLTAQEYAPRGKAAAEIDELWNWVRSQGETSCGES